MKNLQSVGHYLIIPIVLSAVLCPLPMANGGEYRPLHYMDSVSRPPGVADLQPGLDSLAEFTSQLQLDPKFQSLTPARLKRAIDDGDVDFVTDLRQNVHDLLTPVVSVHCGADMLYFVDNVYEFVKAAQTMQSCLRGVNLKVKPNMANCDCVKNASYLVDKSGWVTESIDSIGRLPSGLLHGNFWLLGDYDECMSVRAQAKNNDNPLRMKYCNIDLGYGYKNVCLPNYAWDSSICGKMLSLHYGVCMPESCTNADLEALVNAGFTEMELFPPQQLSDPNATQRCVCVKSTCHEHDLEMGNDIKAIIMTLIVSCIIGVMIAASAYDYFVYKPEEKRLPAKAPPGDTDCRTQQTLFNEQPAFLKMILAFSVITNAPKIVDTTKRPGQIHCLHGIRFLSVSWVILGHTYFWIVPTIDNLIGVYPLTKDIMNQIVLNATYCVDAFFMLSGFLLTYLWLQDTHKTKGSRIKKPGYWIIFYVHRYLRLTPVYMLILGVDVCLYRFYANGPFWDQEGLEPNYCQRSWWTNLLYVNNFFYPSEQCMSWTWYLANDMQFFVFSPIFLVALYKNEKVGVILTAGTLLVTGLLKGMLAVINDLPPTSMASVNPEIFAIEEKFWNTIYIKPYCRCGPYLVGILFGFMMFKLGKERVRLPKWAVIGGWVTATVVHLALLFGLFDYSKTGNLPNKVTTFLYAMFGRTTWAVGLCWVVFACINGYGGFANKFLSWGPFVPLSRLTYCAYLLHPLVAHGTYSSRHETFHFDTHLRMVYGFLGHLVLSFLSAFVFSLAFESPVLRIESQLLRAGSAPAKKKETDHAEAKNPAVYTNGEATGMSSSVSAATSLIRPSRTVSIQTMPWTEVTSLSTAISDYFVDAVSDFTAAADTDMLEKGNVVVETDEEILDKQADEAAAAAEADELKAKNGDAGGEPMRPTDLRADLVNGGRGEVKTTGVNGSTGMESYMEGLRKIKAEAASGIDSV